MFNLVIIGLVLRGILILKRLIDALQWNSDFDYKTKEFKKYIKKQNDEVYSNMSIQVIEEREGLWLEFLLKQEEQMFEELIATRREEIFKDPTKHTKEIENMKTILEDYSKEKNDQGNRNH